MTLISTAALALLVGSLGWAWGFRYGARLNSGKIIEAPRVPSDDTWNQSDNL
jgi:hypothetical protein